MASWNLRGLPGNAYFFLTNEFNFFRSTWLARSFLFFIALGWGQVIGMGNQGHLLKFLLFSAFEGFVIFT